LKPIGARPGDEGRGCPIRKKSVKKTDPLLTNAIAGLTLRLGGFYGQKNLLRRDHRDAGNGSLGSLWLWKRWDGRRSYGGFRRPRGRSISRMRISADQLPLGICPRSRTRRPM
jgi:hypothetical protein